MWRGLWCCVRCGADMWCGVVCHFKCGVGRGGVVCSVTCCDVV